jgi:hypothetical protein
MKKRILGPILLAAALSGGPAWAAQNVANTSQKGSLLIFPKIDVSTNGEASDTFIEISNDAVATVLVDCHYVNEKKGRIDFHFPLTGKSTASFEARNGNGNITAAAFPTNTGVITVPTGNPFKGELVCFAVDPSAQFQVAFNNLTGTATGVLRGFEEPNTDVSAYRYNAFAFVARAAGTGGPAPDNQAVSWGTAGTLALTGLNDGLSYDGCPKYEIASFMPNGAILGAQPNNGDLDLSLITSDNDLSVVSCNQDLRQQYDLWLTKLQFTTWDSTEVGHTGSWACVDSVDSVDLASSDPLEDLEAIRVTAPQNFDFAKLRTSNAMFRVRGVSDTQACPNTVVSGLLGVLGSSTTLGGFDAEGKPVMNEDREIASTLQGAGLQAGFVKFDPEPPTLLAPLPKH